MKKLFDSTAALLVAATILLMLAIKGMIMFGIPVSRETAIIMFAVLFALGATICTMGLYQFAKRRTEMWFGSFAMITFGAAVALMAYAGGSGAGVGNTAASDARFILFSSACIFLVLHVLKERPPEDSDRGMGRRSLIASFLTLMPEDQGEQRTWKIRVLMSIAADVACFAALLLFWRQFYVHPLASTLVWIPMLMIAGWQGILAYDCMKKWKGRQMFSALFTLTAAALSLCMSLAIVELAFHLPQVFMPFLNRHFMDATLFAGLCVMAQTALSWTIVSGQSQRSHGNGTSVQ